MTPPARRDGTPDKKQRASDMLVSNAKPARRQHVKKSDRTKNSTADSVARELGADWLVDGDAQGAANNGKGGERLQKVLAKLASLRAATPRSSSTPVASRSTEKSSCSRACASTRMSTLSELMACASTSMRTCSTSFSTSRAGCSRPCMTTWAARAWATWSLTAWRRASVCSTWAALTRTLRVCSCSPTTASLPIASCTRSTALRRPTSPRCSVRGGQQVGQAAQGRHRAR